MTARPAAVDPAASLGGAGTLTYVVTPHPLREEGSLLVFDPEEAEAALEAVSRGATATRMLSPTGDGVDEREVRGADARLRAALQARARRAAGRSLFYWLLGLALSLLWINWAPYLAILFFWLPPVAEWVASLGGASGGLPMQVAVAALPMVWAWWRAGQCAADARHWGRLARLAGSRRFRDAPVRVQPIAKGAIDAQKPSLARLRSAAAQLDARGADAAGDGAQAARALAISAARSGLTGPAALFHQVYARLDAIERSAAALERSGSGVLTERKIEGRVRQAQRDLQRLLLPFTPQARRQSGSLAPLLGTLAGLASVAVALLLTGTYFLTSSSVMQVEPPGPRIARAFEGIGQRFGLDVNSPDTTELVRSPGLHWSWPEPFASRHPVMVGPQLAHLSGVYHQDSTTGTFRGVVIQIQFRVMDVDRWAQVNQAGDGVDQVETRLSRLWQQWLLRARNDARQAALAQNPALSSNQQALGDRGDQLVEARMDDLVRIFVGALNTADDVKQMGIEIGDESDWRPVQNIPQDVARQMLGQ